MRHQSVSLAPAKQREAEKTDANARTTFASWSFQSFCRIAGENQPIPRNASLARCPHGVTRSISIFVVSQQCFLACRWGELTSFFFLKLVTNESTIFSGHRTNRWSLSPLPRPFSLKPLFPKMARNFSSSKMRRVLALVVSAVHVENWDMIEGCSLQKGRVCRGGGGCQKRGLKIIRNPL